MDSHCFPTLSVTMYSPQHGIPGEEPHGPVPPDNIRTTRFQVGHRDELVHFCRLCQSIYCSHAVMKANKLWGRLPGLGDMVFNGEPIDFNKRHRKRRRDFTFVDVAMDNAATRNITGNYAGEEAQDEMHHSENSKKSRKLLRKLASKVIAITRSCKNTRLTSSIKPTYPSAFLALPREIRDKIYSNLLTEPCVAILVSNPRDDCTARSFRIRRNRLGMPLALLLACRQTCSEARAAAFRLTYFTFDDGLAGDARQLDAAARALYWPPLGQPGCVAICARIRNLALEMRVADVEASPAATIARYAWMFRVARLCYSLRRLVLAVRFRVAPGRAPRLSDAYRESLAARQAGYLFSKAYELLPKACLHVKGPAKVAGSDGMHWLAVFLWDDFRADRGGGGGGRGGGERGRGDEVYYPDFRQPNDEWDASTWLLFKSKALVDILHTEGKLRQGRLEKRHLQHRAIPPPKVALGVEGPEVVVQGRGGGVDGNFQSQSAENLDCAVPQAHPALYTADLLFDDGYAGPAEGKLSNAVRRTRDWYELWRYRRSSE